MNDRQLLGRRGEDLALDSLLARGMWLRERNWRSGHLEIDLVMEDETALRIVEVKSLKSGDEFSPLENMTSLKRRNLIAAARRYYRFHPTEKEVKFDVVTVVFGIETKIEYIPDAFMAME